MPDDYEFYQGAVLRQLVAESPVSMSFRPFVREGRINAFVLGGIIGVYVKYSTKRMSPWRFTFTMDQASDLLDLEAKHPDSFIVFVCETDGLVSLDCASLHQIVDFQESNNAWVRIDRPPRKQYEISGNKTDLNYKVARGIGLIVETLITKARSRYAGSK